MSWAPHSLIDICRCWYDRVDWFHDLNDLLPGHYNAANTVAFSHLSIFYCSFPSLFLPLSLSFSISPFPSHFSFFVFVVPFSLSLSPSHFFLCCRCYFIWPSVEQLRAAAVGGKRVCATTTSSSVYAQQLSRPITEPLCCGALLGAGLFTGRSVVTGSCLVLCVTRLLTCIRRGYDQFIVDAVSDVPFGCCCQEGHPFPPIPVFEIQQNS